jgi:hypothetical protein
MRWLAALIPPRGPDLVFWLFARFSGWRSQRGHVPLITIEFWIGGYRMKIRNSEMKFRDSMLIWIMKELLV